MGIETAIIAASVAAAAGAGMQAHQANKARKDAKSAAEAQADEQNRLLSKAEREQSALESNRPINDVTGGGERGQTRTDVDKTRKRDAARQSQIMNAAGATGRRSTILTSPLGVSGSQATGTRKTLIGE
jgi:hypothetical protein